MNTLTRDELKELTSEVHRARSRMRAPLYEAGRCLHCGGSPAIHFEFIDGPNSLVCTSCEADLHRAERKLCDAYLSMPVEDVMPAVDRYGRATYAADICDGDVEARKATLRECRESFDELYIVSMRWNRAQRHRDAAAANKVPEEDHYSLERLPPPPAERGVR